jgi:hypothetical protein
MMIKMSSASEMFRPAIHVYSCARGALANTGMAIYPVGMPICNAGEVTSLLHASRLMLSRVRS